MKKPRTTTITVQGTAISILSHREEDYISLTDMLRAKDGDFFISDWLRNRNTVEYLGIWESINNPDFNSGEFAIIKSQVGLNSYKLSVKQGLFILGKCPTSCQLVEVSAGEPLVLQPRPRQAGSLSDIRAACLSRE